MNARELHALFLSGDSYLVTSYKGEAGVIKEADETILRALDLLARTEESTDELVRELRDAGVYCTNDGDRYPAIRDLAVDEAAATIVALKAERDALKAHAEAMANGVEGKVYYADAPDVCEAVDAYRAAFPKDAP